MGAEREELHGEEGQQESQEQLELEERDTKTLFMSLLTKYTSLL